MYRGFSYILRPTPDQAASMAQFAGACRLVWNLALEQRRNHWRRYQASTGDNLNYVTQARELTLLRAEIDFIRAVHVTPLQRALKALDGAYRLAWQGKGGYPDFKKKGAHEAFSYSGREVLVEKINAKWGKIRLPKIGWVKFRLTRPMEGKICEVTVSQTALGWQVSVGCLIDRDVADPGGAVGIDRGVTVPLMLSDGSSYSLPISVSILEKRIRKAQRIASRRKRGSVRHQKAQRRVSSLRAKQARIRKHWAHEATTAITRRYGTIVIEKLRTQSMTASAEGTVEFPGRNVAQKRGLNRAILNVGWHQIQTMLSHKAARVIRVNPAYSSQTCSSCGTVARDSRKSQAIFLCVSCGHSGNADHNAAIIILNRGNTPGVEVSSCGTVEAQTIQVASPHGDLRL